MIITQFTIIAIIFILSTIFISNAVPALIRRTDKEGYMPNWLITLGGIGIVLGIFLLPLLYLDLKNVQRENKNIPKYELVEEPLYRKK